MKRWLAVFLLTLLLSGCAAKAPSTTEGEATQIPSPTEEALYDAQNTVEEKTAGAVKGYSMGDRQCSRLVSMGEHHLMLGADTITLLKGEALAPSVTLQVSDLQENMVSIRDNGIAYQDRKTQCVIFLNEHLRKTSELKLPEDVIGEVLIASDWKRIYYCTEAGVFFLNTDTGINSQLLQYAAQWQGISGIFQNDGVLRCSLKTAEGEIRTLAISTQTGQVLAEGDHLKDLTGRGEMYFLPKQTDKKLEYIFGTGKQQPCSFTPAEPGRKLLAFPEADRILQLIPTVYGTTLDSYQMSAGKRTASVQLPDLRDITCVGAEKNVVWFTAGTTLYRWDTTKSAVTDPNVYWQYRYTREDPDEEGLQRIKERLVALESYYGVKILYWEEPEAVAPWDYIFETEYFPEVYDAHLDALERAMAQFPQDFFQKAAKWTKSGQLHIVLVRNIYAGEQGYTAASGIQYQLDAQAYLALALQDGLEQNFYHTLGHLIDAKVLSTCDAYSKWSTLNPSGFRYDNDYIKNQDRTDTKYLEGQKRYFVDHYSMSFAVEDRARILEYACMPNNEEVFASKYMQKKLKTVCDGIREAFALPDGEYIWEQYLKQ